MKTSERRYRRMLSTHAHTGLRKHSRVVALHLAAEAAEEAIAVDCLSKTAAASFTARLAKREFSGGEIGHVR